MSDELEKAAREFADKYFVFDELPTHDICLMSFKTGASCMESKNKAEIEKLKEQLYYYQLEVAKEQRSNS